MKYFILSPLPETKFRGISIFPEDVEEERRLKIKIERMKDFDEIRKGMRSGKIVHIGEENHEENPTN